ncbi:MAG: protein kinase [Nannocystaceae bacterium]|nr:protein kinase [Nannocystaceae bacterium]
MRCPGPETLVVYLAAPGHAHARDTVEEHVDRCPSCRKLIAVLVASGAAQAATSPPEPLEPVELGSVGRYELAGVVGVGAMGIVYRARDPQLERDVALKILRPRAPHPNAPSLLEEAKAVAAIDHPHVVTVYDVGAVDGTVYMAMELVAGQTLRAHITRTPRPWREVVEIMAKAGRGLAAVHQAGLVHCDFKPDNVLVGDDGRVLVVDFGLATDLKATRDARETAPGDHRSGTQAATSALLVGTPLYMAPELLGGGPPTQASDQFAFCVTLFEMLHGERPYSGIDLLALRSAALAQRIEAPLARAVPAAINAAITRGLSAEPSDRFVDLRSLLESLAHARDGGTRGRRVAASLGAVALVGLAGLGWLARQQDEVSPCPLDPSAANVLVEHARRPEIAAAILRDRPAARGAANLLHSGIDQWAQAWRAQALEACEARDRDLTLFENRSQCLADRYVETSGVLDAMGDPVTVDAAVEHALRLEPPACRKPSLTPRVTAHRTTLAEIRVANWTARHDVAQAAAQRLLDAAVEAEDDALVATVRSELGRAQLGRGNLEVAIATLQQAVLEAQVVGDDALVARQGAILVMAMLKAGRVEDTDRWLRHIDAAAERTASPLARAGVDYVTGTLAHRRRDFASAREHYDRATQALEQIFGPSSSGAFEAINASARLSFDQGDGPAALAGFERALAIAEAVWGLGHPEAAAVVINMVPILASKGQADRARELLERTLVGLTQSVGAEHPQVALTHMQLGLLSLATGDPESAGEHLEACVEAYRTQPSSPAAITCRLNLAQMYQFTGRCDAALTQYAGLTEAFEQVEYADEYAREIATALLGEAWCSLEAEPRRAVALLLRVEALAPKVGDPTLGPEAKFYRAKARWQAGDRGPETLALARAAAKKLRVPDSASDPEVLLLGEAGELLARVDAWIAEHASAVQ